MAFQKDYSEETQEKQAVQGMDNRVRLTIKIQNFLAFEINE